MDNKKVTINWTFEGKPVLSLADMPEGVMGFVYMIENLTTKKWYVGRKTVSSNKKRKLTTKEKLIPGNERKKFIYEVKESPGWKTYVGSNATLKEEIKNGHKYTKRILSFCFSKAELTYSESSAILCLGALLTHESYNDWVSCRIYKKHLLKP